jgi:lipoprotein NlpD
MLSPEIALRGARLWSAALCVTALVGCSTTSLSPAPVEDRPTAGTRPAVPPANGATPADAVKPPLPGAENAGKPGYYTVKQGDTLVRVALETGQNWRDLQKWNNLDNPNVIEVGQVLRVVAPGLDPTAATTKPVTTTQVQTRPLDAKPGDLKPAAGASAPAATPTATPAVASPTPTPAAAPAGGDDDGVNWAWPATGSVVAGFDEVRYNKGMAIGGKEGDPVLAAADGRVVYAGAGLRGYGNVVILKHNNTYVTAYAHNKTVLVKEDQNVRRGQKIAEMGSSEAERVQLHFEVRRMGKPVDPSKVLPPR